MGQPFRSEVLISEGGWRWDPFSLEIPFEILGLLGYGKHKLFRLSVDVVSDHWDR
jgi:hypothetical protein